VGAKTAKKTKRAKTATPRGAKPRARAKKKRVPKVARAARPKRRAAPKKVASRAAAPKRIAVPARAAAVTAPARVAAAPSRAAASARPAATASPRPASRPAAAAGRAERAEPSVEITGRLSVFRQRLEKKRSDLLALYRADLRTGQESNDSPTEDIVDRANNAYSRELTYSLSDTERGLVLQIEEALAQIESGTYGRCAHCGQPVAPARLEAVPWARLCIDCQELLEKGLLSEP